MVLIYVIQRTESDDTCPVIETARLTSQEADTYIREQAEHYRANGYCVDDWRVTPTDMPLSLHPEPVMATS